MKKANLSESLISMMAIMKMIKNMVGGFTFGQMEEDMKGFGKTINDMVKISNTNLVVVVMVVFGKTIYEMVWINLMKLKTYTMLKWKKATKTE